VRALTCLLLMARLVAAETVAQCEVANHLFNWHSVWDFSQRATSFPLPRLDPDHAELSETAPAVLIVTVDSKGHVVGIKQRSGPNGPSLSAVKAYMERWTFTPFLFNGSPICMRATVYVYFKSREGRPELIVSGFTDRDQPPGAVHDR
jgi:hypothetical protein